jgi:hypothetical protein
VNAGLDGHRDDNGDNRLDLSDPFAILAWRFLGDSDPGQVEVLCGASSQGR